MNQWFPKKLLFFISFLFVLYRTESRLSTANCKRFPIIYSLLDYF